MSNSPTTVGKKGGRESVVRCRLRRFTPQLAGSETGAPPETRLPPLNGLSIDRRLPGRNEQELCERVPVCSDTKRKAGCFRRHENQTVPRSEEHTSELQSL